MGTQKKTQQSRRAVMFRKQEKQQLMLIMKKNPQKTMLWLGPKKLQQIHSHKHLSMDSGMSLSSSSSISFCSNANSTKFVLCALSSSSTSIYLNANSEQFLPSRNVTLNLFCLRFPTFSRTQLAVHIVAAIQVKIWFEALLVQKTKEMKKDNDGLQRVKERQCMTKR